MKMLRVARKTKGLTMKELGEKVGVSESAISQYETGKREADFETILKIGEVLGCSIDYLLGVEIKKTPTPVSESGRIPVDENTIVIAGRNGSYVERKLTDEQISLMKSMLDQFKPVDDEI